MNKMKIVGWTSFDSTYPMKKLNNKELKEVLHLIKEEIIKNNYLFSGEQHQYSLTGMPVFSDGTCFRASMRCWGHIMSKIHEGPGGLQLSYMDFYMMPDFEEKLPQDSTIEVKPAVLDDISIGCTIKEDHNVLDEAISFGFAFVTTDKVLEKVYTKRMLKNE